jgi:hypothetical protein
MYTHTHTQHNSKHEHIPHPPTPAPHTQYTQCTHAQVADQLVRIAQHHGFDGWLINLECDLRPASRYIPLILHFLAHLRARMREVCGANASVIW